MSTRSAITPEADRLIKLVANAGGLDCKTFYMASGKLYRNIDRMEIW